MVKCIEMPKIDFLSAFQEENLAYNVIQKGEKPVESTPLLVYISILKRPWKVVCSSMNGRRWWRWDGLGKNQYKTHSVATS